jgi:hypothetical protein
MEITIQGIREILEEGETVFMRQGRGAMIHLSVGNCRANNLLCGVTYSRSGSRSSYIRPLSLSKASVNEICKKCLKIVQEKVTPITEKRA